MKMLVTLNRGNLVNKYFQFHIQKERGCSSHAKPAASIQHLSIKVD